MQLTSYGLYCYKMKKMSMPKRIVKLIIGLLLAVIGILLYSFIETESNYQVNGFINPKNDITET